MDGKLLGAGAHWALVAAVIAGSAGLSSGVSETTGSGHVTVAVQDRGVRPSSVSHPADVPRGLKLTIAGATALYEQSANFVSDNATRTLLGSAIRSASAEVDAARSDALLRVVSDQRRSDATAHTLSSATGRLTAAEAAVRQSEQQLAARRAAVVNVWTNGFQTQINQCRGAVDVTARYGVRTIAEHWRCGGSSFSTAQGSTVTVTGLDAGTYRVIGVVAVLNVATASADDLPRGYQLLFQTCKSGNSATTEFVALRAVQQ